MRDTVIRVEDLGKCYRLHHRKTEPYVALRDVLTDAALSLARRLKKEGAVQSPETNEEFWALRNVSFELRRGEVLSIIGRNGAGKSTLLKLLSRITAPSEGRLRIRGRLASLLEVGTGFHPELTGRENIFLNGAILGMAKGEIKRRFDEIVDFAEVAKFLDTPLKRYSSGMYVRLAFAVAAHMEPDILIVDEVLAVGDIAFQRKCLGKIQDVSQGGRTVIFVSHNMTAVKSLTTRSLVLESGMIVFEGGVEDAISVYTKQFKTESSSSARGPAGRGTHTTIRNVRVANRSGYTSVYAIGDPLRIAVEFETDGSPGLSLEIFLLDASRNRIGLVSLHQFEGIFLPREAGVYTVEAVVDPLPLASGRYVIDAATSVPNQNWDHFVSSAADFEVMTSNPKQFAWDFKQEYGYGHLALTLKESPTFRSFTETRN